MMHSVRVARASQMPFACSSSSSSVKVVSSGRAWLLLKKLDTGEKSDVPAGMVMFRAVAAPGTGLKGAEARNQTLPDCADSGGAVPLAGLAVEGNACAHCQKRSAHSA